MKRLRRYVPFVLVALVAFCIGGLAWSAGGIENLPLSAAARQGDGSPALTPAQLDDQKIALAVDRATQNVVDNARPAVVEIKTTFPAQQTANSPFSDPFFSQFFGPWYGAPQQQQPEVGVGSGFIIDQDGHILTNEHVVGTKDQNAKIQVKISTP
ncbi:MAG TPA: hypothetical protein VFK80_02430, partial [Limnochordia bacterium]|nr:hypothetical protein [Limnochordia bacterium]